MKVLCTFAFIAACSIVFVLEFFIPIDSFSFIPAYALSRPWTLVTSIFLHANLEHLFFNMVALFMFGISLESRIRQRNFILIFFLAGVIGNLGYMVTAPTATTPAVGASGAIYGIMGALVVVAPTATVYLGYLPMPIIFAAFIWTLTEFLGLFVPDPVAHGAHLAGLFMGIMFGFYIRMNLKYSKGKITSF